MVVRGMSFRVRTVLGALLGVCAVVALMAVPTQSQAALKAFGPIQPSIGYPAWYQDNTGLQLEMCLQPAAQCGAAAAPDQASPPSVPGNFPSEGFYWLADASMPTNGTGQALLVLNVTATGFGGVDPTPGHQITFGRVRVRLDNLQSGQQYTVTEPFGTHTFTATNSVRRGVNFTDDIGCLAVEPCDFGLALGSKVGPFLRWDPAISPTPPPGFIGDAVTPHRVVGGPNGNVFRVDGPSVGGPGVNSIQTNLFTVTGKVAGPPTPLFLADPPNVAFADQVTGTTSAAQTITVRNGGLANLVLTGAPTKAGANAADFAISADTCAGATLAPGVTCTTNVTFAPGTVGAKSASIVYNDNAGGPHSVPLTGKGVAPAVTITPGSVAFPSTGIGTSATPATMTIANSGDAPLHITTVSTTGANAADFPLGTNVCNGTTVAPGANCQITVGFVPTAIGARTGSFTVTSDAPTQSSALSGTGTSSISITPSSWDYGAVDVGAATNPTKSFTVKNETTGSTFTLGAAVTGDAAYSVVGTNGCASGTVLGAQATCSVTVQFDPASNGAKTGSLTVTSNAPGSPHSAALTGSGFTPAPEASLSPTSLAYGTQGVGHPATKTTTLTNTGELPLTITNIAVTAGATDYSVSSDCPATAIPHGGTCTISATFNPTAVGSRPGTITVTSNSRSNPNTVALSGTGIRGDLGVSPGSLTFGNQVVGTTSAAQTLTVTNIGTDTLNIGAITKAGANPGDYLVGPETCSGAALAVNGTCTIDVRFKPTIDGSRSAQLSIASDAPISPKLVNLTGTATAPTVDLFPSSLEFGDGIVGGASDTQNVIVTNSGGAPLTVSGVVFSNREFRQQTSTCTAAPVAPGGSCTIGVRFHPSARGDRTGTMTLTDNAPGTHTVSMHGFGIAPQLVVTPTSLNFGSVSWLGGGVTRSLNVTNIGDAPLTITTTPLSASSVYSVPSNSCAGAVVPVNGTCVIDVRYTSGLDFSPQTGQLTINSNSLGNPSTVVPLAGSGQL
jgi:hypothetical protein